MSCINNKDLFFGGDWAGHSATFDSVTGALIPVPEQLVPESMIEWGQIPSCLEVITSENAVDSNDENYDSEVPKVSRIAVTVMPEVGCGVDNLDTTKQRSTVLLQPQNNINNENDIEYNAAMSYELGGGVVSHYQPVYTANKGDSRVRIETVFVRREVQKMDNDNNGQEKNDNSAAAADYETRRVRLQCDVLLSPSSEEQGDDTIRLVGPVTVVAERKTSDVSTHGDIAKGGGLDGRTVARLVGMDNLNRPFAVRTETLPVTGLAWERSTDSDVSVATYAGSDTCLKLPLGLVFRANAGSTSVGMTISCLLSNHDNKVRIVSDTRLQWHSSSDTGENTYGVTTQNWLESLVEETDVTTTPTTTTTTV